MISVVSAHVRIKEKLRHPFILLSEEDKKMTSIILLEVAVSILAIGFVAAGGFLCSLWLSRESNYDGNAALGNLRSSVPEPSIGLALFENLSEKARSAVSRTRRRVSRARRAADFSYTLHSVPTRRSKIGQGQDRKRRARVHRWKRD